MKKPLPFGKYYLLERINVGGMAEVFKAKSFGVEGFERIVAVKRILPSIAEDQEFITMFIDEAKVAVQLTHANIAQIFDLGKVGDSYFIAMEYVHGRDLRAIFDRSRKNEQPIPVPMACYTTMKVCEGLDYAHNKKDAAGRDLNLVHRDVSPQNILISYDGEVKVIDFGIAKAACRSAKTQAGILKGKFGYMSPEQVRGLPLDRRSDIFSVGIVLYELLTLERLFQGESDFSTLEKVRNVEIMPPSTYNPRIPDELEQIVLKALSKEVEDRYQTAMDLHDDLQSFMYTSGNFFARKDLAQYVKGSFPEDDTSDPDKQDGSPKPSIGPKGDRPAPPRPTPPPRGASAPPPPPRASAPPVPRASAPPPPPRSAPPPPPRSTSAPPSAPPPPPQKQEIKKTLLGMPAARRPEDGASPSGIPQDLASGRVATPVSDDQRPSLDMDWDDEELATQVYDKPSEIIGNVVKESGQAGDGQAMSAPPGQPIPSTPPGSPSGAPSGPPPLKKPEAPPSMRPSGTPMGEPSTPPSFEAPGVPISEPPPPTHTHHPVKPQKETKRGGGGIVAVAIIIVLVIAGVIGYFFYSATRPGRIDGTVRPSSAQIMLGNESVSVGPRGRFTIEDLNPGRYTLTIRAEDHQQLTETITIEAGSIIPLPIVLDPVESVTEPPATKTGIAVLVRPEGASIFINNEKRSEVTPSEFIELPPGQYNVRVEKEQFLPLNDQVTVNQGVVASISRQLQPEYVTVNLTLSPEKARCKLSQEGQTDESVKGSFKVMPHRSPELTCDARGYDSYNEKISLPEDGTLVAAVNVSLTEKSAKAIPPRGPSKPPRTGPTKPPRTGPTKPPTPPPTKGTGYLSVNTRPWTKVYVDGRFIRNTPLMRHELPSGAHRLTLINEDFNIRETVSVRIKGGENTQIIRNLVAGN